MMPIKEQLKNFAAKPFQTAFAVGIIATTVGFLASPYDMLSLLPGLLILSLLLFGRFPQFGYYLIVFVFPFGAYRGLTGPYWWVRIHWVVGFCLLIIVFLHYLFRKRLPRTLWSGLWPWILAFFAINLISAYLSTYPETAFKNVLLLGAACLFIALSLLLVSSNGFRQILPLVIISSISIGSLLAVLGYTFNLSQFAHNLEGFKRGTGATVSANSLAMMIIFAMPFLVHYIFYAKGHLVRSLAVVLIVINLMGMVTTYSRGGFLILILVLVGLLIEYLRSLRPKHLGLLLCGVGLVLLLALVFVPSSYWKRQKSVIDQTDSSIARRTSYLYVSWDAFKKNPILGSGPMTFKDLYARSTYARQHMRKGEVDLERAAHNTYLEVLVGTGALGLAVFLALPLLALYNFTLAKKAALHKRDRVLASLIGAYRWSFISIMIFFLIFSDPYYKYFLLSLSLSQVALRVSQGEPKDLHDEAPRIF